MVEPHVDQLPRQLAGLSNVVLQEDLEATVAAADAVLLLVDHDVFKEMNVEYMADKPVLDTRGIWQ